MRKSDQPDQTKNILLLTHHPVNESLNHYRKHFFLKQWIEKTKKGKK